MSTGDSNDGDESTPQLPAIVFRELVETERARIEVERAGIERDNRRSQVAEKELAVVDAQDQRQFEYASATLGTPTCSNWPIAKRSCVVSRGCLRDFSGSLVLAVLGFAFLGNDAQRTLAQDLGGDVLIAIAGFGVITAVGWIIKGFTQP